MRTTVNRTGVIGFGWLAIAGHTAADTPAFDRPGISISTSTIPQDSFAVELGTPDFVGSSASGNKGTLYSLDSNVRVGLGGKLEAQIAAPLYVNQSSQEEGSTNKVTGFGDASFSLKTALPCSSEKLSWSALAGITFATGNSAFTAGHPQYRLASALGYKLDEAHSAGFYVNANYLEGHLGYTLSPNLNFGMNDTVSAFLEAGYTHAPQSADSTVAGGGFAWMVAPTVQLDMSVDFGVTRSSPDLQGGIGVSMYFK